MLALCGCSCWACSCLWQNSTMNISFFGAVRVVSSDSNIRLVRITWQFTLARLTRKSQSQVSTSSYVAHYESLSSRIFHAQNSRLELNFRRRIKIECPRKPPERQQKKKNGNSVQNSQPRVRCTQFIFNFRLTNWNRFLPVDEASTSKLVSKRHLRPLFQTRVGTWATTKLSSLNALSSQLESKLPVDIRNTIRRVNGRTFGHTLRMRQSGDTRRLNNKIIIKKRICWSKIESHPMHTQTHGRWTYEKVKLEVDQKHLVVVTGCRVV